MPNAAEIIRDLQEELDAYRLFAELRGFVKSESVRADNEKKLRQISEQNQE